MGHHCQTVSWTACTHTAPGSSCSLLPTAVVTTMSSQSPGSAGGNNRTDNREVTELWTHLTRVQPGAVMERKISGRAGSQAGQTAGQDWDGKYYDTIHHHQTLYGVVTVTGVLTLILMMFVL